MNDTKKLSLLVMAAGMGTRYGGIKQMEGLGPSGETIMDYSLFDAIRAGFSKIIFVVREEIRDSVEQTFFPRLEGKAEVCCVVQSLDRFVPSRPIPAHRSKPWGTAHAMLCGREVIEGPFAVINADDFYGYDSFVSLASFLRNTPDHDHAMVGYILQDVLSDYGSVSRGIAQKDKEGFLESLSEVTEIVKRDGKILSQGNTGVCALNPQSSVSMNSWGFMPGVLNLTERMFVEFVEANRSHPKAEFYIAKVVTEWIKQGLGKVHIIPGGTTWFGITYREDKERVSNCIQELVRQGKYPLHLW